MPNKSPGKIPLKTKVEDKISGFEGTVTGFARYITGCDQYLVSPKATDKSKYPEGTWFDENRLKVIGERNLSIKTTPKIRGACETPPAK